MRDGRTFIISVITRYRKFEKKKTRARKTDLLFRRARDEKSSFECVFSRGVLCLKKTAKYDVYSVSEKKTEHFE